MTPTTIYQARHRDRRVGKGRVMAAIASAGKGRVTAVIASAAIVAAIIIVLVGTSGANGGGPTADAAPAPTGTDGRPNATVVTKPKVAMPTGQWTQWSYLNLDTAEITHSGNDAAQAQTTTESMVKVWLAADYLRRNDAPTPTRFAQMRRMIRDSNDTDAETIYRALGRDTSINRMIKTCGLKKTTVVSGWWSQTSITADDAARLGLCIYNGKAAGLKWTSWLLTEMQQIHGEGAFGIPDALPDEAAMRVSYKNGWTLSENIWTVNCLGITDHGVIAILQRYPADRGLDHGGKVCASIARNLHDWILTQ